MVDIYRSHQLFGTLTCIEDDPDVVVLKNCILNPSPELGPRGLYDCGRKLIVQSAYSHGPDPGQVISSVRLTRGWEEVGDWADEPSAIYLGIFHHHYGHFLLSTLSRLWAIRDLPPLAILCITPSLEAELAKPYVRDILQALEIDPARFTAYQAPVKLREVVLPFASFEEQSFAHRTFARFCNGIGDRLVAEAAAPPAPTARPLFLSKRSLRAGIRMIENEADICERLEARGVEIATPEQLPFAEQVALWRTRRPVVSFSGSALHTSLFTPHAKIISIDYDRNINSSFPLCDWANGGHGAYFSLSPDALDNLGQSPGFGSGAGASCVMRAREPAAVADAILRAIEAAETERGLRRLGVDDVSGDNLSRGKPTAQSSTHDDPAAGGPSATSGFLSGTHQFHTACEDEPWWQVDLGSSCRVENLVIFNRTDAMIERAANLEVAVSIDGESFVSVHRRFDSEPFGGLNGSPLTIAFEPPHSARWLRLSLPGPNFFHLDQVEVFGTRDA